MPVVGGEASFHGDEQQCVMSNDETENLINLINKDVNSNQNENLLLDPSISTNSRLSDGSNEGDNDDVHRPLKKRRQRRLEKPVNSSSTMYTNMSVTNEIQIAGPSTNTNKNSRSLADMKNKLKNFGSTSVENLREMMIQTEQLNNRLRRHQLILSKMVNVLFQLATQLGDKFYLFLTGKSANVDLVKMVEAIQTTIGQLEMNNKEEFINEIKILNEQYQMLLNERNKSEEHFNSDYLYSFPDNHDFREELDEDEINEDDEEYEDDDNQDADFTLRSRGTRKPKTNSSGANAKTKISTASKALSTRKKLKRKRTANPTSKPQRTIAVNKDKVFYCDWPNCSYETKREWALNEHTNITHTGQKQFSCKVEDCQQTFYTSAELDIHMKRSHSDIASREFMSCTWPGCSALFKSKLGLRGHLRTHRGENLIACDWPGCTYMAKNKRQSENHQRKHTGDRPYRCGFNNCESSFRTNDSLRHHRKCHSDYRPFWCDWPGKLFYLNKIQSYN